MFNLLLIAVLSFATMASDKVVPGEYIVKIRKGFSAKRAFSQGSLKGLYHGAKRIPGSNGRFAKIKLKKNSIARGVRAFANNSAFEYIEPNYIHTLPKFKLNGVIHQTNAPADKMFKRLWGLNNPEFGHDIGALNTWKKTKGSKEVVVAVVDTGIDYKHPDLAGNMWRNNDEIPGNGIDDDNNGYVDDVFGYDFIDSDSDPMDEHSHGSHCAGTIGAVHNSIGVAGVAAKVSMMAVKIFTREGRTDTASIVEAIYYAIENGAHVLSNSWGGGRFSKATKEAIQYGNSKGVIFVAAAGNSGTDNDKRPHYPSNYEVGNIIAVAAHDKQGRGASFTCYGERTVDVAAPGVDILSTIPGGKYASYSGTSMATPHVSGVVALMLSKNTWNFLGKRNSWKNLNVVPSKVRDMLIKTSRKHDELNGISVSNGYVRSDTFVGAVRK